MERTLFLHFGPGGSAHVERSWLGGLQPRVNFWDQPRVRGKIHPYMALGGACAVAATGAPTLMGHSFGADLAQMLLTQKPQSVRRVILISPMLDVIAGLERLGDWLVQKRPNEKLVESVAQSRARRGPETFWPMIGLLAGHPDYEAAFWHDGERAALYATELSRAPAFDLQEWQVVMSDFLFGEGGDRGMQLSDDVETFAIFGERDPYLYGSEDLDFWKQRLGSARVAVFRGASHFPHLESPRRFADQLSNWKV